MTTTWINKTIDFGDKIIFVGGDSTITSLNALTISTTGSTKDITVNATGDIALNPAGADITIAGVSGGAAKLTIAGTSLSIYGGDTTGDDLSLIANSVDTGDKIDILGTGDMTLATGTGKIILDAKTDIDIDPEGADINLLGAGAGKITTAATSISIYGGDTTGDDLFLYPNTADVATEYIKINGGTSIDILSTTKINLDGAVDISGSVTFDGSGGTASVSGLLMGIGTDGSEATTAVADAKFMEFRCESTATSGDNRLQYLKYLLSSTGGGECLRAQTMVEATIATAHGGHIGLTIGSDAGDKITGLGAGVRSTLMVADKAVAAGGTYWGGMTEIYMEGTTSDLSAVTNYAIHAIEANGDTTGVATVLNAMAFKGSTGTGKMIYDYDSTAATESNGSIRILVDEGSGYVAKYIRYWDAQNS